MSDSRKKRVFVIDDDLSVCDLFKKTLESKGFEVFIETDPDAAIEKAADILPDLIFIGLLLRGTNGLKVSKAIHAINKLRKVPVVMLISYKGELDPKYTVTIGIVDVMVKPLNEQNIISKTISILGRDEDTFEKIEDIKEELPVEEEKASVLEEEKIAEEEAFFSETVDLAREESILELPEEQDDIKELFNDTELKETEANEDIKEDVEVITKEKKTEEKGFSEMLKSEEENLDSEDEGIKKNNVSDFQDEEYGETEQKKKVLIKRILIIASSILVVSGIVAGIFFIYSGGRDATMSKRPVVVEKKPQTPLIATSPSQPVTEIKDKIPQVAADEKVKGTDKKEEQRQQEQTVKVEKEKIAHPVEKQKEKVQAVSKNNIEKKPVKKHVGEKTEKKKTYTLQAGLFSIENNAISIADRLKGKGYRVTIKKEERDGKVFYRVLAGDFSTFKEAKQTSNMLLKEGITCIVRKN